ncbi:MAG: hypothetical protein IJS65_09165 [Clostridia bacterium]|nr:hypothetical protein [Clostridia bacterium]
MKTVVFSDGGRPGYKADILSYPAISWMIDAVSGAGDGVYCAAPFDGADARAQAYGDEKALFASLPKDTVALVFTGAFPCLSRDTVEDFYKKGCGHVLRKGDTVAAYCVKAGDYPADINAFQPVDIPDGEWVEASSPENVYAIQEALRRKINLSFMKKGVYLVDPNTTHISPKARVGAGTRILPGCLIYGESEIGENCVIGPNSLLRDAHVGDGTTVNASQITKSSVGRNTTVGPFAYIRPDCMVGDNCRIGDFVELKNSYVGNKTKVSHLTYIGDSDFGENINVGCGVVTVNYDGMNKYRTTVGDNAFIGCNVNLVAPVTVGAGAFIAAGSTITREVTPDALAIARERQSEIKDWAKRRREAKKLK